MSENNKHKTRKRRLWPWIVLAGIIVFVLLLRLSLRLSWTHNMVKHQIEQAVESQTGASFSIQNLEGDLLNNLRLTGIILTTDDPILKVDTLEVAYVVWPLFSKRIEIKNIYLSGAELNLTQYEDGKWNFDSLITAAETDQTEEPTAFGYRVLVKGLSMERSSVHMVSEMLPDGKLSVENLSLAASMQLDRGDIDASLQSLEFKLVEGRLPEPINVSSSASYKDDTLTLEKLLIDTGRSVISSEADFNHVSEHLEAAFDARPLSGRDMAAYLDEIPEINEATIRLRTTGTLSDLDLTVSLKADDILDAEIQVKLGLTPEPVIHYLELNITDWKPSRLVPDTGITEISAGQLNLKAEGAFYPDDVTRTDLNINLGIAGGSWEHIRLGEFNMEAAIHESAADIFLSAVFQEQDVSVDVKAANIWDDLAELNWQVESRFNRINVGYFVDEPDLATILSGQLKANGTGTEPGAQPWKVELILDNPVFEPYSLDRTQISAEISDNLLKAEAWLAKSENLIEASLSVEDWNTDIPEWSWLAKLENIDLAELAGLEELPTLLNIRAESHGKGMDPLSDMEAVAFLQMQPSLFAGQRIDSASVNAKLDVGILNLEESYFYSRFINGRVTANQNLNDMTDPDNQLDYDIEIGRIDPFASLVGLDTLSAEGKLSGNMQLVDGNLNFNNTFDIKDIIANQLFVEEMNGNVLVRFLEEPEIKLDVTMLKPAFNEHELQDVNLAGSFSLGEVVTRGSTEISFIREGDYGLFHSGEFMMEGDLIRIDTHRLDINETDVSLSLTEPFSVMYEKGAIQMDTLKVVSVENAHLDAYFSRSEAGAIDLYLLGSNIGIGALQSAMMDEVVVDGIFSGRVTASMSEIEDLRVSIEATLDTVLYNGLDLDQIGLLVDIQNERLKSNLEIIRHEEKLVESQFDLPFKPGDPETFTDDFFDEPVTGFFRVNTLQFEDYETIFSEFGFDTVTGTFKGEVQLEGLAGNPGLTASVSVVQGNFSGVPVDSLITKLQYDHDNGRMHVDTDMISLGQNAMHVDGSIPFFIDWRTFAISGKEGNEKLDLRIRSNNFDLSVINEFIDRDTARNLRGRLNSELSINGTVSEPLVEGFVNMSDGQVYLVDNNITIRNIIIESKLEPDAFILDRLRAESTGTFTLNGRLNHTGFVPDSFDFSANMQRFRVFNTRDIEIIASLNARLSGTESEPKITGNIFMDRGFIYLDNFGETPIEQVVLEEDDEISTWLEDMYERFTIEMNLNVDRRFFVRNRNRPELDLELEGSIDAVKEAERDLELFGDMNVVRGTANQLGRRFVLDEGAIIFSGPAENPELNIRLKYELRREDDIIIWYVITGDVEEPVFSYESDPEMELQDIISYTIFGRPFNALSGWQQGISGGAGGGNIVADAAMDLILERIETLASDRLGIDVLEIDHSSSHSGTSIKAGKYFTDKLFVAIVQELSSDPSSQVIIEYLLRRNLELIFTGSDDYRTGVDILWRLDY